MNPRVKSLELWLRKQPHFAWDYIIGPRLLSMTPGIGFMSLGPYINTTKGVDVNGNDFPRIMDIFSAFRGDLCPPGRVLVSQSQRKGNYALNTKNLVHMGGTIRGLPKTYTR